MRAHIRIFALIVATVILSSCTVLELITSGIPDIPNFAKTQIIFTTDFSNAGGSLFIDDKPVALTNGRVEITDVSSQFMEHDIRYQVPDGKTFMYFDISESYVGTRVFNNPIHVRIYKTTLHVSPFYK